jgi:hypothetical protein
MTRPKSADPRTPVTIRLPMSVIEAYQAGGRGWRDRMEAALVGAVNGAVGAPVARPEPDHVTLPAKQAAPRRSPPLGGFDLNKVPKAKRIISWGTKGPIYEE